MSYTLLGGDGRPQASGVKGQWGGHRPCATCCRDRYDAWNVAGR